ncbi:MAG TPA: transglycosylase SLT domain-containing protein [Candidatus Cloacimonadota bacterium]|jgi:Rod binding domain-containing protein|nr:transglycosylase SLT domain-containing protein [Candidatus Cloacimonadales bacterium]HPY96675.1 transglycosylase SLT domain-containing protein [Candidatus Cloacimonadota bacterium]HQB41288.1 transglycosylase SLT domain-containing protein [Candidatus Cloacimonadota bacterium]
MSNMSIQEFKNNYSQQVAKQNLEKATNLQDANLDSDTKIKEAAVEFEKIMVKMMFSEMTKSLDSGGFFGSEAGSDFYQDMYIDSISDMMSKNQSLGLSDMIVRQLKNDYSKMPKNNSLELLQRKIEKRISEPVQSHQAQENTPLPKTLMARLDRYEPIINKAADKYDIDKSLIKAVIAQESYGNHKAISPVGAKGLMQLMDGTANDLGVKDPFNPEENIMAGAKYLKQQLNKFKSNELALAAYNAGPGNVTRYNGVPPFKETKNYIRNVMRFKNTL